MKFYLLASGSKGNCFLIKHKEETIVIDCGSTKRYLLSSFQQILVDYQSVDGVLLTHEHSDHISQLKLFKDRKIFAPFELAEYEIEHIHPYTSIQFKSFRITPIPLSHDCSIAVGYIIEVENEKLVYVTDTGYFKESDYTLIRDATYYIFESNHDPELLMKTKRPYLTKQRILSMTGHLSNDDCADILNSVVTVNTKEIVLAHLSEEANTIELAEQVVAKRLEDRRVRVRAAKQFEVLEGGNE